MMKSLSISGQGMMPWFRPQSRFFYGYFVVAAAFFILLVMFGAYYSFGVFFKPVVNEFGWSRAMTSGAFSLASTLMGLIGIAMGIFTDKFGPRLVMTLCGLVTGLGYVLMSRMSAVWQLYVFYGVLVGAGMGGTFVPLASTVARWFVRSRSLMTGIITAGIGIGALAGPPAVSRLISAHGWREAYTILGGIIFAVVVLSAQFIKRDPIEVGQGAYGGSEEEQQGLINPETVGFSLKQAASTKQFWLVCGMFICFGFSLFSIMVHIVPHVTEMGISASRAARILATIGGLSIIGKVLLGRVGDLVGSKRVFMIGSLLMAASLYWLVPAKTMWMLYIIAAVFGLAYGGNVVSQSPLVAMLFGLSSHGLILGVLTCSATVGGAIGASWCGYMFDKIGSYQLAFLACAVLSSAGLFLTMTLKPTKQQV
jgi:MFS family permease